MLVYVSLLLLKGYCDLSILILDVISIYLLQISDVAEEEVRKLEKKFKEGSRVRVRILGCRQLEGLTTGILKVVLLI